MIKKLTLKSQKRNLDVQLLVLIFILTIFGLIFIYDSSAIHALRDFGDSNHYIKQQIIWALSGLAGMLILSNIDYHRLQKLALPAFATSLLLMIAVSFLNLGTSSGGAERWLNLGFFTLQPSEIYKLTAIIWLSVVFQKGVRIKPLFFLLVITAILMSFLQKDLGSALVLIITIIFVYIVAGGSFLKVLAIVPVGLLALLILIVTSEYRKKRILAFFDPFSDTQGFTYHISQVIIALGSGGLWGLGIGQSRQKFEYIPEVTTDSIFAIIGEELGFLGGILLIGLFCYLCIRGFKIAKEAPDNFGRILAVGLISLLCIQAITNFSSMVSLMPLTGVPLPFISYGGSALLINLAAVGILLNISKSKLE